MITIYRWNCFNNLMEELPLTNNGLESYHHNWNSSGSNTNNVWDTVKHFKSEEVLSATKFRQAITSNSSQEREEDTTPPHPSAKVQYKTVQYSTVKYREYSTV